MAVWHDSILKEVYYVRSPNKKDRGAVAWADMGHAVYHAVGSTRWDVIAHEQMQVYRASLQKGDPNDLLELSGVCGWICGLLDPEDVVSYLPRTWKGQVPKDVHAKRILGRLTPEEAEVLKAAKIPKSLEHNAIDSIGIGLYYLRRL